MEPDQRQSKLSSVKIKDHSIYNAIMYNLDQIDEHYDDRPSDYCRGPSPATVWDNIYNDFIRPNVLVSSKMNDATGRCILHYAIEKKAPEYIVNILMENNLKAIQSRTDEEGAYPLHLACRYRQSVSVILYILKLFPKAAQYEMFDDDYEKYRYPLILAFHNVLSETVVHQLLTVFPEVAQQIVEYDFYPLHYALHSGQSEDVVLRLLDLFPAAAQHTTFYDGYPLHIALRSCASGYRSVIVIKRLLRLCPVAAQCTTYYGSLPLHLACFCYSRKQSKKKVAYLLDAYPEACQQKNDVGQYPLHIACQCNAPLSVLRLLLLHFPDALEIADEKHNRTPLDWALHPGFGEPISENVKFLMDLIAKKKQTVTVNDRKRKRHL